MTVSEKQLHNRFYTRRDLSLGNTLSWPHKIVLGGIVILIVGYVFLINSTLGGRYSLKNLSQQANKLEQKQNELQGDLDAARSLEAINIAGSNAGFTEVVSVKYLQLAGGQNQKLVAQR